MTLLIHIIRNHFSLVCTCNKKNNIFVKESEEFPKGYLILTQSCGIARDWLPKKVFCKNCKQEYDLKKYKKMAENKYELLKSK